MEIIDKIYNELDEGNFVTGIYFDLQKAFDTVNHEILLRKLYSYGIRGMMYEWVKNYLSNRYQYTSLGNNQSSNSLITCGVPQGSVLGPIFFLIYINDIPNALNNAIPRLFADDTNLFLFNSNLQQLTADCNESIHNFYEWSLANKLSLNLEKTCYQLFVPNTRFKNYSVNLFLNLTPIKQTHCTKYLGLNIDDKLSWSEHINNVRNTIIKYIGIFYKIRYKLPPHCLKNLYFATVYPHLLFGIELYANTCKSYLNELMILNNKILRVLQNKPLSENITNLYLHFNILPIDQLLLYQYALFAYKYYHNKNSLPDAFSEFLKANSEIHEHNIRRKNNLRLSSHSSSRGHRSISTQICKYWNELPNNLKELKSLQMFKVALFRFLMSRQ